MKNNKVGVPEFLAGVALVGIVGVVMLAATAWVLQVTFNAGVVPFSHSLGFEQVREVGYWATFGTTVFAFLASALLRSKTTVGGE